MLKIMLIRHFATPGNEKRQYIGSTDEVLSEKTAFLKRSYPIPEYIIASPMKRCVQTAKRFGVRIYQGVLSFWNL